MTTITEGMTPTQFINVVNGNFTSVGFHNTPLTIIDSMLSWEQKSTFGLNGISTTGINLGMSGSSFITAINNSFNAISLSDKIITGIADVKTFGATGDGTTDDVADINTAVSAGNIIIQNGIFKISASIKIPSNRIVYLWNCKIKMADASYDNFFRNSDFSEGNSNIYIIGLGNVTLDGNAPNNLDNTYINYGPRSEVEPYPTTIYRYVGIVFCNVDTFEISNLNIYDYSHWAILLQKATNGSVHDLSMDHHTLTVNQDGIDIYRPSNDIEIFNISIRSADDPFCCAASLVVGLCVTTITDWNIGDVHDIYFHDIDIYNSQYGSLLAIIAGDGGNIYNIVSEYARIREGGSIFFSNYVGYVTIPPVKTEEYSITMRNILMDSMYDNNSWGDGCFVFGQDMMDFSATNIINNTGYGLYTIKNGDQSDNVKINGTQIT